MGSLIASSAGLEDEDGGEVPLIPILNHRAHRDRESPGRIPHHPLFLLCGLSGYLYVGSGDVPGSLTDDGVWIESSSES